MDGLEVDDESPAVGSSCFPPNGPGAEEVAEGRESIVSGTLERIARNGAFSSRRKTGPS